MIGVVFLQLYFSSYCANGDGAAANVSGRDFLSIVVLPPIDVSQVMRCRAPFLARSVRCGGVEAETAARMLLRYVALLRL